MDIFIYARKSVLTDKGDSISNQIKLAKEHIKYKYPGEHTIHIYKDEGYSGATTNRPDFVKMMRDITTLKPRLLVCYRLDRISRNVLDFSETFETLQKYNVDFLSVNEQLDTSTPIGRAMMYICSVFAQMERETIAERIRDSSLQLAKSGKWAGGKAPIGYRIDKRIDPVGKRYSTIIADPVGKKHVEMLKDKILQGYSLSGLETYFRNNNILNPSGNYISSTVIYNTLTNPTYYPATQKIWDYYNEHGCTMECTKDSFDGSTGVISYRRTSGGKTKKHSLNDMTEWIITKGMHSPILSEDDFFNIHNRFGINKICKKRQYDFGLLRGILYCGNCMHVMSAKRKLSYSKDKSKTYTSYYYSCGYRNHRGKNAQCTMKQVSISILDDIVVQSLYGIAIDQNKIYDYIDSYDSNLEDNLPSMKNELANCKRKISNLISTLEEGTNSAASKYIIENINSLDSKIKLLEKQISQYIMTENSRNDRIAKAEALQRDIASGMIYFKKYSFDDKINFVRSVIKRCIWDGNKLKIEII